MATIEEERTVLIQEGAVKMPKEKKKTKKGVPADLVTQKKAPTGASGGVVPGFGYQGGPVVENPQVYTIFLGDWSGTANTNRAKRLSKFIDDLMHSHYMLILTQYGCGISGQLVNQVQLANTNLNLSDTDIHSILQDAINNGKIPEPNNRSNVYVLFLDNNTGVKGGTITMCEPKADTAFGYHDFFLTAASNPCYYAVIPGLTDTCLTNSCPSDPNCSLHLSESQEQRQTQVASHEFSEMISDPQLNAWLDSTTGNENGDICNGNTGTLVVGADTWTVQLMYSKLDDMISSGNTTCIAGLPAISAVPLARYWNPVVTDHFYTTELNELSYDNKGWKLESIQCYINRTHNHGSVPLYRYWNLQAGDHFYTTNWNELGYGEHGWTFELIQGYVYTVQRAGTVPLYRYWNANAADHFYTTNWNELGNGAQGWIFESIQCYVYPGI